MELYKQRKTTQERITTKFQNYCLIYA